MFARYLAAPALLLLIASGCDSGDSSKMDPMPAGLPAQAGAPAVPAGGAKKSDVAEPAKAATKLLD